MSERSLTDGIVVGDGVAVVASASEEVEVESIAGGEVPTAASSPRPGENRSPVVETPLCAANYIRLVGVADGCFIDDP